MGKHAWLISVWLSAGACGSAPQAPAADRDEPAAAVASEVIDVLPGPAFLAAYENSEGAYLIDVRTPREQAGGMLDGALAMDFLAEGFRQNAAALDRSRPVFVYCAKGGRSAGAAEVFEELGWGRVVDLEGGYGGLE